MLGRVARLPPPAVASCLLMASCLRLVPTAKYSVWCLEEQRALPSAGETLRGVTVVKAFALPNAAGKMLVVSRGSVVDFEGDAIVNAANSGCLGGGGVDGAITAKGGPAMAAERRALPIIEGTRMDRCATGDAKMTTGGGLLAKKCIHAVGPNYLVFNGLGKDLEDADRLLTSAYRSAVRVAQDSGEVRTLGFSLLSAGIFRGPRPLASVLELGVRGVVDELAGNKRETALVEEVHLVAFTEDECAALVEVADRVFKECSSSDAGSGTGVQ